MSKRDGIGVLYFYDITLHKDLKPEHQIVGIDMLEFRYSDSTGKVVRRFHPSSNGRAD